MNTEVIKSYLVAIGFDVDGKGFKEAQKSFGKIEQAINSLFKKLSESGVLEKFKKKFQDVMGNVEKRIAGTPIVGKVFDFLKNLALKVGVVRAGIAAAVIALGVIITKVTYDFMAKMAAADMEVQKLALSLYTTTQNARSLKAVMESMGVGSIEELRSVAMNPELRAQFMSLRKTAAGLEGGADVQQGFKNTRAAGLEVNRLGVIMNYFWQNLGGKLGHALAGPLKAFEKFMATFNKLLIDNMPVITDSTAGLFTIGGVVVEVLFKLLDLLTKIAQTFNWLYKLIDLGIEITYGGLTGKLAASVTKEFIEANKPWFDKVKEGSSAYTPTPFGGMPGHTGSGGHINNPFGKPLGEHMPAFLKELEKNITGSWVITSGIRHLFAHDENEKGHGKGRKVDIDAPGGILNRSDADIAKFIHGLVMTKGFEQALVEGFSRSRYGQVMSKYKDLYGSTPGSNVQYYNNPGVKPHIDVLTKPIQVSVTINGNVGDEKTAAYLGDKIGQQFRTALGIRNQESAWA